MLFLQWIRINETVKTEVIEGREGVLEPPIFLLLCKIFLNVTPKIAGQNLKSTVLPYAVCPSRNKHCASTSVFKTEATSPVRFMGWPRYWRNNSSPHASQSDLLKMESCVISIKSLLGSDIVVCCKNNTLICGSRTKESSENRDHNKRCFFQPFWTNTPGPALASHQNLTPYLKATLLLPEKLRSSRDNWLSDGLG